MMKFIVIIFILFQSIPSFAQTYIAKIIGVKDGDTVVILWKDKPQTVRLAHVDCPEKNQPFGAKAKQYTSDFCFGKTVQIVIAGKPDRNGRWIAEVLSDNQNLGKQLVRCGLAWHFKKYSKNLTYAELERAARKKKTGLWSDPNPVAPWDWRKHPELRKPTVKPLRNSA